ncbi:MAG: hypothetical protein ACRECJ_08460, partial [Limisphaerales bacterium]
MNSEEIKRFFDLTKFYKYQSLDIRIVAYKFQDKLVNVATRIVLGFSPHASLKVIEDLPSFDNLTAIHEVKPVSSLEDILENLSNGKFLIRNKDISYV